MNSKHKLIAGRTEFEYFRRLYYGKSWFLQPINPYERDTEACSDFRKFEKRTFLEIFSDLPKETDYIHLSEINIEYVQVAAFKLVYSQEERKHIQQWRIDVQEAAVIISGY